jgi:glutamyl-tRNA reductase
MHVGIVGIHFKTADLALHEFVARGAISLFEGDLAIPMVLLSTCNRTEIYFSSNDLLSTRDQIVRLLETHAGRSIGSFIYSYFEKDCFVHLCRVVSGLDSVILFETEIVRQVKIAYSSATKRFVLPSILHYLFQKSLQIGKAVRTNFVSQKERLTLFYTLWSLADSFFQDLRKKKVLLVGYSQIHRKFALFLKTKGVFDLTFCSRFPQLVSGWPCIGRESVSCWNQYDLISSASTEVRTCEYLISGEGKKTHLIFDLSVPRNVDPNIEKGGVVLFNMEQINDLIEQKAVTLSEPVEEAGFYLQERASALFLAYINRHSTIAF